MNNNSLWNVYMKSYDSLLLSLHAYKKLMDDIYRHALAAVKTMDGSNLRSPWMDARQVKKMNKRALNILEVGCGTGNILKRLKELQDEVPGKNIILTGIDRSDFALKTASYKMKERCRLFKCDLGKKRLGMKDKEYKAFTRNPFDLIIINNVIFALSDNEKKSMLDEIKKIMSKGGVLITSEPHDKAALSNIFRDELSHSGHMGVLKLLFKGKLIRHLVKVAFINLVFFSKNICYCSEKQKKFMGRSGLRPVAAQHEAYGGNNVIHIYKKI